MTTATKTETVLEEALRFQTMSLDELRDEANRLGVRLEKGAAQSEIIDALIAASVEQPATAESGILVSLHSQTEEARNLIVAARNVILQNEQAGKTFSMFLRNREGSFYTQRAPGCRLSMERLGAILDIATPLPDGSQEEALTGVQEHPEQWENPLLVRVRRRNSDGSYSNYVMLYLKKKQKLAEQSF
jgi:hypothetical protein